MNYTSCEELLQEVNGADSLTDDIIHVILPQICGLIDRFHVNTTQEEIIFHDLCCNPIPTMVLNKTVTNTLQNLTEENTLVKDLCHFMKQSNKPEDAEIYADMCIPKSLHVPDGLEPSFQLLTWILLALGTPIGFFANILILLTVYKVKRLRNTTGYFICNLAIADLLVIVEMLLFVTFYKTGAMDHANLRAKKFVFPSLDVFLGSASLLHVTAVSIERGVAVSMPLNYPRYLSERRAKRLIQCIWAYCLLLFGFGTLRIWIEDPLYEEAFFYTAVTCSFFIPCILVLTSYSFILVSALKNMKMEKKISKVIIVISMLDEDSLEKVQSMRPARYREIKIALNVAIMTLPFVCGWGYFMICNIYEIATNEQIKGIQNWLIPFIPFLVSCLNPLTYLMFTRSLRKSSWLILSKLKICELLLYNTRRESVNTNSMSIFLAEKHSAMMNGGSGANGGGGGIGNGFKRSSKTSNNSHSDVDEQKRLTQNEPTSV